MNNDAKLAIVKWADNKTVTLVSSCASVNLLSEYNTHMGGEDLVDMMIALYHTPAKPHRWYRGIFWRIVDIAVNNAWLLHWHDAAALGQKNKSLKDFRISAARGLMYPQKQKKDGPPAEMKTTYHQE